MSDTAQLREALDRILHNFQMSSEVGIPIARESEWEVAFDAARELLTIREAGALIITPDEALVERVALALWDHGAKPDRHMALWSEVERREYLRMAERVLAVLHD